MAICSGPVDGDIKANSSTRAELFGIASSLLFLTITIKAHKIDTQSEVQTWSNSAASLARLHFLSWTKHPGYPLANADIVSSIADLIRELPVQTTIRWIKAHQDNDSNMILTSEAAMNVKADDLATSFLKNHQTEEDGGPLANSAHFQAMHASLINNGTRVHSRSSSTLRTTIQTNRYDAYFQNKHRLSTQNMKSINWDNLKSAYLKQDHKTQAFIAKFIHGWLPCGTRRKMIEQGKDKCPYCGFLEQNEHMRLRQNTKAVYHQGGRVTAMTTQLRRHQGGQATTSIWMGLLKHIMQAKQGQYIPKFPPNTPDFTKRYFMRWWNTNWNWAPSSLSGDI